MLTRLGDSAHAARLLATLNATTARVRAAQMEISTGKQATRFDEISAEAGLLLRTKEQRTLTATHIRQNEQVIDRLNAMSGALGNLGGIGERMRTLLTQRLDAASGPLVPLDLEADTLLAEAAAQLNLRLDERYLFAGSRIDTPPVQLPAAPPAIPDPALYYHGDAVTATVRADRDVEVAYGITASEPAIAQMIAAIGQARQAHLANDRAGLQAALTQIDAAVGGLAELRGQAGATSARLEAIADGQRGTLLYLDEIATRIEDADLPEAMTRLARDQASLEATYLTTSRLSQLSLADYLR